MIGQGEKEETKGVGEWWCLMVSKGENGKEIERLLIEGCQFSLYYHAENMHLKMIEAI